MQLKKQRISIEMMQYFSIKKKSVPIVLPGQNILSEKKIFSPEQNFFTGTNFFRWNKIFHSGSIQYGGRQTTKDSFRVFWSKWQRKREFREEKRVLIWQEK